MSGAVETTQAIELGLLGLRLFDALVFVAIIAEEAIIKSKMSVSNQKFVAIFRHIHRKEPQPVTGSIARYLRIC